MIYYIRMIYQKGKVTPAVVIGVGIAGVFLFSLFVLVTTENTIIVVNEAVEESKEVFITGDNLPVPEVVVEEPELTRRVRISETGIGFLNVRDGSNLQAKKIGTVKPQEVYEYTEVENNWYHIVHPELQEAWVSGLYVKEVDRSSDLFSEPSEMES